MSFVLTTTQIYSSIGNDLRMDYKAIGNTVNLAACMEQTTIPGTVQLTEHNDKLVKGYVDCIDLGLRRDAAWDW